MASVDLNVGSNGIAIVASNACGAAKKDIILTRKKPCTEIVYNLIAPASPVTTSTEENYAIELNAAGLTSATQVKVKFNGENKAFSFDPVTGNIKISGLKLIDGTNTINVVMTNDCSSKTVDYKIDYKGCIPPVINISGLSDGMVVHEHLLSLTAQILNTNSADDISLKVNGESRDFTYNETTKNITASLELTEGGNSIEINVNGCEKATRKITINYEKPCTEITTGLMFPASASQTVVVPDYNITLTAHGVENASQIKVNQNGSNIPFTFTAATNIIEIAGIMLVDGVNTIVVDLSNACSKVQVKYTITYNGCKKPVITAGANPTSVSDPNYTFTATISNIAASSDIQFLVNGAPSAFVFDPVSGHFTAEIVLSEGLTNFILNANGCEKASLTAKTTYKKPCEPLIYALNIPNTTETSVADPTYTISLVAQHVTTAGIAVQVNGTPHTFNYVGDLITIPGISLNDGANTVVVNLKNDCSSETVTYMITHNNCNAPVIDLSASLLSVDHASYILSGNVENIDNAGQLVVKLNGANVPFTFDATSGSLTANLTLAKGDNNITVDANGCEKSSDKITIHYEIPCIPLTYTLASPTKVNSTAESDRITITLNTTNVASKSAITVTVNGAATDFTFSGGHITVADVHLNSGTNTVVVALKNDCSNQTITYTIDYNPCVPPAITLTSPTGTVSDPSYPLAVTVLNVSAKTDISVKLNGTVVPFDYNTTTHQLTATTTLNEGVNTIEVVAKGCEDRSTSYTLTYERPCDAIKYNYILPNGHSSTSAEATYYFKLKTWNVASKDDITFKLNGADQAFTFNAASGMLESKDMPLVDGDNTVTVTLKNGCSTEDLTFTINYAASIPCDEIKYNYILPTGNSSTSAEATYYFKLKTWNVASDADITFKLNGASQAFTFNSASGMLESKDMPLVSGTNTVVVTLKNDCSNETITYTIDYNPCIPPAITLTSPTGTVSDPSYPLAVTVLNVSAKTDISVKLNGTVVPFDYNTTTHQLTATTTLNEGVNTIEVVAKGCEDRSTSYTLTYERPCDAIKYNYILPNGHSSTSAEATYYFKLKTWNVASKDDITFKLNGADQAFTFNAASGMLESKDMPLVDGDNTVTVTLKNGCSTEDLTFTITYHASDSKGDDHDDDHDDGKGDDHDDGKGNDDSGPLDDCSKGADGKVTICHFPPGNPDNPQTITISESAVKTHVDHHDDYCGPCEDKKGNDSGSSGGNPCEDITYTLQKPSSKTITVHQMTTDVTIKANNVGSSGISAVINGVTQTFTYNEASHLITLKDVPLNSGNNLLKVVLKNDCSNEVLIYNITAAKSAGNDAGGSMNMGGSTPPPVITPVSPTGYSAEVNTPTYLLKARIQEIKTKTDLQVYVNGQAFTAFTYSSNIGQLSGVIKLNEGVNTVRVVATNSAKSVEANYKITYKKAGSVAIGGGNSGSTVDIPPVITLISPNKTSETTNNPTFAIKAKITNVSGKSDITVTINGRNVTGLTYNTSSQQMTLPVQLSEGANAVKITAKNGSKVTNQTCTITYNKASSSTIRGNDSGGGAVKTDPTPVITYVSPNKSTATTTNAHYTIKAKVSDVQSKANIKVYLNGTETSDFTYNATTDELIINLSLKNGANTIKVTATNGSKSAEKNYSINYKMQAQGSGIQGSSGSGSGTIKGSGSGTTTTGNGSGTTTRSGGIKTQQGGSRGGG